LLLPESDHRTTEQEPAKGATLAGTNLGNGYRSPSGGGCPFDAGYEHDVCLGLNRAASRQQEGIAFAAVSNGASVVCVVSRDALRDHFGAREFDQVSQESTFHAKKRPIEAAAQDKINNGAFEP